MKIANTKADLVGYHEICSMERTSENADVAQKIADDLAGVDAQCLIGERRVSFWRRLSECADGKKHQIHLCKEASPPAVRPRKYS